MLDLCHSIDRKSGQDICFLNLEIWGVLPVPGRILAPEIPTFGHDQAWLKFSGALEAINFMVFYHGFTLIREVWDRFIYNYLLVS